MITYLIFWQLLYLRAWCWYVGKAFQLHHNMIEGVIWWIRACGLAWVHPPPIIKPWVLSWGTILITLPKLNYFQRLLTLIASLNIINIWLWGLSYQHISSRAHIQSTAARKAVEIQGDFQGPAGRGIIWEQWGSCLILNSMIYICTRETAAIAREGKRKQEIEWDLLCPWNDWRNTNLN